MMRKENSKITISRFQLPPQKGREKDGRGLVLVMRLHAVQQFKFLFEGIFTSREFR